jgi:hypothetical protein
MVWWGDCQAEYLSRGKLRLIETPEFFDCTVLREHSLGPSSTNRYPTSSNMLSHLLSLLLGIQFSVGAPFPEDYLNQMARQLGQSATLRQASRDLINPLEQGQWDYPNSPALDPNVLMTMSPTHLELGSYMNPLELAPAGMYEQLTQASHIEQSKRARNDQSIPYIQNLRQGVQPESETSHFHPHTGVGIDAQVLSSSLSALSEGESSQEKVNHFGSSDLNPFATSSTESDSEMDWLEDFFNDKSNLVDVDLDNELESHKSEKQKGKLDDESTHSKHKHDGKANRPYLGAEFFKQVQLHSLFHQPAHSFSERLKAVLSSSPNWPLNDLQGNMQELPLHNLINHYQELCRLAINNVYQEFLFLSNSWAEVKQIGNWPVGLLMVTLENVHPPDHSSVHLGAYKSLILPYQLKGDFYSPEQLLKAFNSLHLSLYYIHNALWGYFNTNDTPYSDYQKLLQWLHEEVFNCKNEITLFGKTHIQVSDAVNLGTVQFCIVNLLENPGHLTTISLMVASKWFDLLSAQSKK